MKYDFDVVVIGGGAAGLVAATGSAGLGARTAMIDKTKLGGDCTWYGCIPSKALLKSAQVFSLITHARKFGINAGGDFRPDGVMGHVREVVKQISLHHPPEVFEKRGIKVLFGNVKFLDAHTVELDSKRITAKRFIVCTGSGAFVPPIEGLKDVGYLTNEDIFDLPQLPQSIIVLGAGPIGVELSQAFARLGVEVSLVEMAERILIREDKELARAVADRLIKDGVKIFTAMKAVKFSKEEGTVSVILEDKDKKHSAIKAQKVLVAVGRQPNVRGLDLEKAGVKYSNKGIEVDAMLETSARNIFACGDVVGPYQFSHIAEYQAIIAAGNAVFPFKRKVNYESVAWCTFTEPELAHLGLTEDEAKLKYKDIKIYKSSYAGNDRAVTDGDETGLVKVICDKKGLILGAHIVGANAGEIIHEYVLAKSAGIKINKLSSAIHIYPTIAQVVKRSADQYYMEMLSSGWFKSFAKFFVALMR